MRTRSRGIDHAHRDRDHARATLIVKHSEANLCTCMVSYLSPGDIIAFFEDVSTACVLLHFEAKNATNHWYTR